MPNPLSDAARQQIADAHAAGESQSAIAKRLGFSKSTVNGVVKGEPPAFERSNAKKGSRSQTAAATTAHVEYTRERRRALVSKLLDLADWTADQAAEKPISPRDQQFLMTTVGIGLDKLERLDDSSKGAGGEILDLFTRMEANVQRADRETGTLDSPE